MNSTSLAPAELDESSKSWMTDATAYRLFLGFCLLHFLVWVIIPTISQPNACLDTIEMIYWGHEWQLGYSKHPPLPAWIAEGCAVLFGSVEWPFHVISQLMILACFWSVWVVTAPTLGARVALMAVVVLEGCYYYQFTTTEFNNNSLSRVNWALTIAFLYLAFSSGRLRYWALCGLTLGLGMLSKYDTAFLALTMVLFSMIHPQGRAAWRTPGPFLAVGISLICFGPHLYWLITNDFPTIRYVQSRSTGEESKWIDRLTNPAKFVGAQLAAIGLTLGLMIPSLGWRWRRQPGTPFNQSFGRDFILFFSLVPIALIFLIGVTTGVKMKSLWGSPLFTFIGAAMFCLFQYREDAKTVWRVVKLSAGACLLVAAVLIWHDMVLPVMRNAPLRICFPGQELAAQVDRICKAELGGPAPIVGGNRWLAGNVAFYSPSRPSVYADLVEEATPWVSDELLNQRGGVILWNPEEYTPEQVEDLQQRYPKIRMLDPISLSAKVLTSTLPVQVQIAIVPPQESATESQAN